MSLDNITYFEMAKIVIPGIIAFISGRYLSRGSQNLAAARESFNEVYSPMYKRIHPYLYKKMENSLELQIFIKDLKSIYTGKEHLLIGDFEYDFNVLIRYLEINDKDYQSAFNFVCFGIERTYFKLKSKLGYSTSQSISYRVRNAKLGRFKSRFNTLDILVGEIFIVVISLVLLVLASQQVYNFFVYIVNLVNSLP